MPIDRESDTWRSGSSIDRLGTNIGDVLMLNNPDKAFRIEEIVDWVQEEVPYNIPQRIREQGREEDIITLVRAVLDRLERRSFVTARYVEEEDCVYYAHREGGLYPNVRIENEVIPRIEELESDVEELRAASVE